MDIDQLKLKSEMRSEIGRMRLRIRYLEGLIVKYANYSLKLKVDSNTSNPFKEFFRWLNNQLKTLEDKYTEKQTLEAKLLNFESKLENFMETVEESLIIISHSRNSIYVNPSYLNLGAFLEKGSKVYVNVINSFLKCIEPQRINSIVNSKNPNALSYIYIAILARFTLLPSSLSYRQIYKQSIRLAKKSLPDTYSKPSYDSVITLFLFSSLYLSHCNYSLMSKFLTSAIRMAQMLGYDKYAVLDEAPFHYNETLSEKAKGARIWSLLSLSYFVLSTISPTIPFVNLEPPANLFPAHFYHNSYKYMPHSSLIKKFGPGWNETMVFHVTVLNMTIISHIQSVKMKYKCSFGFANVPPERFRLPTDQINNLLVKLLCLQNKTTTSNFVPRDVPEYLISYFPKNMVRNIHLPPFFVLFNAFTIIYLYYPSVLVYPQPAEHSKDETMLLFEYSNNATDLYLSFHAIPTKSSTNKPLIEFTVELGNEAYIPNRPLVELVTDSGYSYHVINYDLYVFSRVASLIFVYLNIIHKANIPNVDPFFSYLLAPSVNRCYSLISMLYNISKLPKKCDRFDSVYALEVVKSALGRFFLPDAFIDRIKPYFTK